LEADIGQSTYRHTRDNLINQVRGALNHAPGAARGPKSAALARKRDQLLMGALGTACSQETVSEDAALEKSLELGRAFEPSPRRLVEVNLGRA
jgi:hypothetical protein